jgi:tryptophan-rich sensory protein
MTADTVLRKHDWAMLTGWVLVCEAVGGVSGWLTAPEITSWYPTLTKPTFNPPNWIFGPVWTALFALMGIAAWLVWRAPDSAARTSGLRIFWMQLALNFLWSMIFFRGHALLSAAIEIVLLLAAIVATTKLFGRVSRTAAWLMLPYAGWVGFATVLTWAIWRLNG